jgi:hypothetical protein
MTATPEQPVTSGRPALHAGPMERISIRFAAGDLAQLTGMHGTDAHEVIRQLAAAYLGKPGAAVLTAAQRAQVARLAHQATRPRGRGAKRAAQD